MDNKVHILIYKEEDSYKGICIEYNIVVTGKTEFDIRDQFEYWYLGQALLGLKEEEMPVDALRKLEWTPEIVVLLEYENKFKGKSGETLILDQCKEFGIPYIAEFYKVNY